MSDELWTARWRWTQARLFVMFGILVCYTIIICKLAK